MYQPASAYIIIPTCDPSQDLRAQALLSTTTTTTTASHTTNKNAATHIMPLVATAAAEIIAGHTTNESARHILGTFRPAYTPSGTCPVRSNCSAVSASLFATEPTAEPTAEPTTGAPSAEFVRRVASRTRRQESTTEPITEPTTEPTAEFVTLQNEELGAGGGAAAAAAGVPDENIELNVRAEAEIGEEIVRFGEGQRVEAKYGESSNWYTGIVLHVDEGADSYIILWDELTGEREQQTPAEHVRAAAQKRVIKKKSYVFKYAIRQWA